MTREGSVARHVVLAESFFCTGAGQAGMTAEHIVEMLRVVLFSAG